MIDPRVQSLCEEVGLEAIEGTAYPRLGQTRAVNTIKALIDNFGEEHTRLVLMTLAETENNKACLDSACLWATSDLVRVFSEEIEKNASLWMELWDQTPVGYLQSISLDIKSYAKQRHVLCGMIYERLRRVYGEPDLLER